MIEFFKRRKPQVLIVEREPQVKLEKLDQPTQEAIIGLQFHPGFQYLMQKLRYQRGLLQAALQQNRQETMADVEFLKSGIAWTGWLEQQIATETRAKNRPRPEIPTDTEEQAFKQIEAQLEEVGL